jgi:death-on-curing protein
LPSEPRFLTVHEVIALHVIAVHQYGGATELIDRGKLESAVAVPMATFDGRLLNETIEEQAAAYWHGICQAHAFLDGNKRLSLFCANVFLLKNGHRLAITSKQGESLTMRIAKGKLTKADVTSWLKGKIKPLV